MVQKLRGLAVFAVMAIAGSFAIAAPAIADPTIGSIAGHLTDGGNPVSGVLVFVTKTDGTVFRYDTTDSEGSYEAADLTPGGYKVEFNLSWGRQYAYQANNWDAATVINVTAGAQTTVDDSLLPTGSMSGRFTDQQGNGLSGVNVWSNAFQQTATDAGGYWNVPKVFVGSNYYVAFNDWNRGISQFAYGKLEEYQAARFTVTAGNNTVVDDVRVPTGSVRITARDGVTGAPVESFDAYVASRAGSTQSGAVVLTDVPVGTFKVNGYAQGYVPTDDGPEVTISEGQQSDVGITFWPEARIEATIVDAVTGAPLAGVCVAAVSGTVRPSEGCGNLSDADGKITVGFLRAGRYQLVAFPTDAPGYGAQWVGANGGTGKQHLAAHIEVQAGQTGVAPVIRMDPAGSITGRVTMPDGSPAAGWWAGIVPVVQGSGEIPAGSTGFDSDGRYTLANLGPYDWQLFFNLASGAPQFSGGVGNRLLSRSIAVTAGGVSTYDFTVRAGVQLTTKIVGIERLYPTVYIFNAVTGDLLAFKQVYPGFEVTFPVIGPQFVRIAVDDGNERRWHDGPVWIPASGSKTIVLNFS